MNKFQLDPELLFKKNWVWDPPPFLAAKMDVTDLAKVALTELRAKHAILKIEEEAVEEIMEVFTKLQNM